MRHLLSSFLLCLVACGGSVADDGTTPTTTNTPTGPTTDPVVIPPSVHTNPAEVPIEGSFDLSFTIVTASKVADNPAPTVTPPSLSTPARLDIVTSKGVTSAQITGRWGQSGAFGVTVTDSAVTLDGSFSIGAPGNSGYVADEWKTLVLARGPAGGLTGAVTATGRQSIAEGDVLWSANLQGSGTFLRDHTKPELRLSQSASIGPTGEPLPWERFTVQAAEPVSAVHVRQQCQVQGPGGDSMPIRWTQASPGVEAFATEAVSYVGTVDDWSRAGSGEAWNLVSTGSLVNDMVGLSAAPLSTTLPFSRISAATTEVGFDGGVLAVDPWGTSAFLQNDPRCESGGCLALGPTTLSWCAPARNGFAGLLVRGADGQVSLRYRVLAKDAAVFTDLVTLELAAKNGEIVDAPQRPTLAALPSPIGPYAYGSDWTTVDVPAPAGMGEIGYAVVTSSPTVLNGGCGGPPPPSTDLMVLVESVKSH